MNLNFLFGFQNNASAPNANSAANALIATGPPADMSSFKAGQTIKGEVVLVRNNEVILELPDGGQLSAKLTKDIPIQTGQMMTFEVKSNSGSRLSLSPLFENMGHDPNALKALNAAGLKDSAQNIEMVSLLMRQGLAVDKNSLLDFNRQMMANPTANPITLAQMNRLDLPVTPENIRQFEAYKNYEHQISSSVREITDGLIKDIGQMAARGETDNAVALFKQVLNIFNSDNAQNANAPMPGNDTSSQMGSQLNNNAAVLNQHSNNEQMITADDILRIIGGQGKSINQDSVAQNQMEAQALATKHDTSAVMADSVNPALANPAVTANAVSTNPAVSVNLADSLTGSVNPNSAAASPAPLTEPLFLSLAELNPESREQLALLMREAGFSQELANAVSEGNLNQASLLSLIGRELNQNPELFDNAKLASLLVNRDFQAVIKNDINNQWLLKPEDVSVERNAIDHFNKIFDQTNKLLEALNSAGRGETAVSQAAANLSNNINFVNQLNQMFTYMQIPLKMNGENTHSELFVYTNKKNLAKKDGNVSALLHLDMANLGPLDIYIAMQNNQISTKFYLANDKVIDLIEKHIHILDERLALRGYSASSEFIAREPDKKPIDEILATAKNVSILASYSFDARA